VDLNGKTAIVYGAGGAIGGAVSRAFAAAGARVYLAGRTLETVEKVAGEIRAKGGKADTAVVDALDEQDVDTFVDRVAEEAGSVDISFNLILFGDKQRPLLEISVDDFLDPIQTAMRSHFLTTRAAARHMVKQRSGVVLAFGGGGPQTPPGLGGFKIALDALEGHRRQWAVELGKYGVRVITLKTGGIPESLPPGFEHADVIETGIREATLLKRAATLADVGNAAVFAASDLARTITGADINISAGAILD
jgi:NAD(P)-dependent dehydrogenase (short-subunit alcohol dehydrogenase family)